VRRARLVVLDTARRRERSHRLLEDTLANGAASTITVVATVGCAVPEGTKIVNTATVSAETPPDSDPSNNSATTSFTVDNPVPVVTASVEQSLIPQNNHELINVGPGGVGHRRTCPAPRRGGACLWRRGDQIRPAAARPSRRTPRTSRP
jgi:hypothetical protein